VHATHLSESRRTINHILLSQLRLTRPGGPGPRIHIPRNRMAQLSPRTPGSPLPTLTTRRATAEALQPADIQDCLNSYLGSSEGTAKKSALLTVEIIFVARITAGINYLPTTSHFLCWNVTLPWSSICVRLLRTTSQYVCVYFHVSRGSVTNEDVFFGIVTGFICLL
jgi:hypothetical protein